MRFRAPALDDAQAVLALLLARERADLGMPDDTLEEVLDEWRASDVDLAADAGIGRRLLDWAEHRERERGRDLHRQWAPASNARAQALLTGAGYGVARSYWRMERTLDDFGAEAAPPSGVRLRPVDVARDAVSLHALDARSFAANPGSTPESTREFREEHLEANAFDASLSRVAVHAEDIAGFLLAQRWEAEAVGFVDVLAVDPDYQGRGIGTALLSSALAAFASSGLRAAQLGVDSDNPRALRIYERAGMTVLFQYDVYERSSHRRDDLSDN